MHVKHDISRLNSQDFLMLALSEVSPSLGIVLPFRFKEPHPIVEMREALRYMFSMYPRLRSVVEPTLRSYRLKILEDHDPRMNMLFEEAFQVIHNLRPDTDEYLAYRRALLNEPFSLQQGLPLKMRYLPDDPQPMLLLSLHHMVGDGMSWLHLEHSLMRYLNGDRPQKLPLDESSLLPAFVKKSLLEIPTQITRSIVNFRADLRDRKGQRMIPASAKTSRFFGTVDAWVHTLSIDLARLHAKCRELEVSENIILLTALTMLVSRGPGRDMGNAVGIAIPIDMRPFFEQTAPVFGNFVANFWLILPRRDWDNPRALLNAVKTQMYAQIERYQHKENLIPYLIEKAQTLVGRKIYARMACLAKCKGLLPISCAFSAIGNIDRVNSYGAKAQVCETMALMPHYGLFLVTTRLEGKLSLGFIYPEAEFNREEIEHFIQKFDEILEVLVSL